MTAVSAAAHALLALVPTLPLLAAGALIPRRWRAGALHLAPWAALPGLLLAAVFPPGSAMELPWLLLGARLGVDDTGRVFLLFTALLWWIAGLYGVSYLARDPRRFQFFGWFLGAMAGNVGLIVAQDMVSFFLFFALMSFASYGLVNHRREPDAIEAGRVYMVLVVVGEVLLFVGLVMAARAADSLAFGALRHAALGPLATALFVTGFAIKAGALPLHVWLPLAHPAAPIPASAVLSGAMIKAGLLGWLRFLPVGETALPDWGTAFVILGLAAAFLGVVAGVGQRNPKTVLAYSSISQMGLMTVLVGVGLMAPDTWPVVLPALLLFATHHALVKGGAFLGLGPWAGGGAPRAVRLGLTFLALALAGAPLTSGALAKSLAKSVASDAPAPWGAWLPDLLLASTLATTLLMGRFLYLVWTAPKSAAAPGSWRPWAVLLTVVAAAPLWLSSGFGVSLAGQAGGVVPIAIGALVVAAFWMFGWGGSWAARIPPGDLIALLRFQPRAIPRPALPRPARAEWHLPWPDGERLETWLGRWAVAGVLWAACALALMIALAG